ncbi:MAG: hypothetical protein K0R23_201 [Lacrimispora sp.]|nr:hypothetical protein [Lacrimispora sp.]
MVLEKERYLRNNIVVHYGVHYGSVNDKDSIGGAYGKTKTKPSADTGG